MQRSFRLLLAGLFTIGLAACGTETVTETVDAPRVTIDGPYSVLIGENITLTADTLGDDDASYTWTSADAEVATVDADGVVTGVAAGEVMIQATGADSGLAATRGVVVLGEGGGGDAAVPTIAIAGDFALMPGETTPLSATTTNGADSGYTWTSSADAVATVDATGLVTAVADGDVVITATGMDTGATATHGIAVRSEGGVAADPYVFVAGDFVIEVGGTVTLTATTMYGEDASYAWTSSDDAVATVDDAGVVTGHMPGEAVITATGADTGAAGAMGVVVMEAADDAVIPMWEAWAASPHADATAEAFIHWDEDGEISTSCARCHSEGGYMDYLGADGSEPWVVDEPAAIGTTVSCQTCHNAAAVNLFTVVFPSGVTVSDLGSEARCMTCHQGRASTVSVNDKLVEVGDPGDDDVTADLSFINVHYKAAGATLYGGIAMGGYQYDGMMYDTKNHHSADLANCVACHDQHTTEVRLEVCTDCHMGLQAKEDYQDIRMFGSVGDYDGDGDTDEGIYHELMGQADTLYAAIQAYADTVVQTGVVYDSHAYPYFFTDTDGDGEVDEDEANYGNKYASWTPRLLRAAYNYQYFLKDTGAYAHNPKYVIQLLHDSITDLNSALDAPVDFSGDRYDGAHFRGSTEAFRHWDEDGEVSSSCSKCHTSEGFVFYTDNGVTAAMAPENGMKCDACHTIPGTWDELRMVDEVEYPSGITISDPGNADNLCGTCHSGRQAKANVDAAIADDALGFKNVHYLPAASVLQGTDTEVGYEYEGETYAGKWTHVGGTSCTGCHAPKKTKHSFDVHDNQDSCFGCHQTVDDLHDIRMTSTGDYDGDGSSDETLMAELDGLAASLYTKLQAVAADAGSPIVYDSHAYPYFFKDTDGDGEADADEANYGNSYKDWTPALLKASFNYQLYQKEHGAWAHNFAYMGQLLHDSIMDLDPTTTGLTRP